MEVENAMSDHKGYVAPELREPGYDGYVVRFESADGLSKTERYNEFRLVPEIRRPIIPASDAYITADLLKPTPVKTTTYRTYRYYGREGRTLIYKEAIGEP